ncbi:MAG: GGDEF domain-containing protein [Pseudomonadota bacterium]
MDTEAERWKAEYRSVVAEQEAQTQAWLAIRRLLQEMLRAILNACIGWSAEIDEEIDVLRLQVERATSADELEALQHAVVRIATGLSEKQQAARGSAVPSTEPDIEDALRAIESQFVERLAAEPMLAASVANATESTSADSAMAELGVLADALIATFRELSAQKAEAERFVGEVTATLASLERWTADGASHVDLQRLANDGLRSDVDREVDSLRSTIDGASNLGDLKRSVRERINAIATRIQDFRDQEDEKLQAFEQRNTALDTELAELRVRTEALREQLEQQEQLLLLDTLTRVHSRFAYDRRLDEEIAAAMRSGKPLCYSLWDIDYFKQINDRYGHQAGDEVLTRVASYLSRYTRTNDFVARIGGEEFVILFPDTSIDDAAMIADKVRALIGARTMTVAGEELAVTISCGVSTLRLGDDAEQLYRRADENLYAAKKAGRNQCMAV